MKHSVIVIGLGRFGTAAALELMQLGHEVLAIDADERRVNDIAPEVTYAHQLDATDDQALRSVGAAEFEHAIVAISGATEASIFATMALRTLGVANVVAKAGSVLHGAILERVGATRVVHPEQEMGRRVAHAFEIRQIIDYLDVAPDFGIVKTRPPASWHGRTLGELDLAGRYRLSPIVLRRGDKVTINPDANERIDPDDELTLIGRDEQLEQLAE
jgi:trk system potassium uptake protein TrkA